MPAPRQTGSDVPHGAATLVDVLRHWAELQPHERVFTFLVDGETHEATLTFRELDRQARAVAAMLDSLDLRGRRALLLYAPGLEYVCGFLGCLYAGVVAVPVYPPDPSRLERTLPRLQAIAQDAQASVALTSADLLALSEPIVAIADELRALRWLSTDTVDAGLSTDTVDAGAERDWRAPRSADPASRSSSTLRDQRPRPGGSC
jgi:acyl-CoA synthetase (AMP-forming)/AMP-acid ligase II